MMIEWMIGFIFAGICVFSYGEWIEYREINNATKRSRESSELFLWSLRGKVIMELEEYNQVKKKPWFKAGMVFESLKAEFGIWR
ncbi:MAG: hypothetical protein H6937_07080 [Burkholderiales bacterium]|nr:hypothetical protein [Burkholderiales bacterium]